VIARARPGARKLALFAVIAGVAAGIALGVIGCVEGVDDADLYGRVSLPGKGALDLPEGDVALYYESHVDLPENDSLDVPSGLRVVAQRENTRVRSKKVVNNELGIGNRTLREFAKLEIPREGRYRVTVRSEAPGAYDPAVTFGKGQLGNLGESGLRAGLPMAAGMVGALLILLFGRIGYEPLTPQELAASLPAAQPRPGAAPWASPGAPPIASAGSAPAPPPAFPTSNDPVEAQLRDLERRHAAGQLSDEDYREQRQRVLDAAFRPPGSA
jgi:hypothetical protein